MRRLLTCLCFIAGCDGGVTSIDAGADLHAPNDFAAPPPFCTDNADGGPPATLASVETITKMSCIASGCHGGPDALPTIPGFDLRPSHVYASVVGVAASETCGGVRVVPGDPVKSYLYQKLVNKTPCSPMGSEFVQMPRCEDGSCPIPDCQISIVRQWIADGAKQ